MRRIFTQESYIKGAKNAGSLHISSCPDMWYETKTLVIPEQPYILGTQKKYREGERVSEWLNCFQIKAKAAVAWNTVWITVLLEFVFYSLEFRIFDD